MGSLVKGPHDAPTTTDKYFKGVVVLHLNPTLPPKGFTRGNRTMVALIYWFLNSQFHPLQAAHNFEMTGQRNGIDIRKAHLVTRVNRRGGNYFRGLPLLNEYQWFRDLKGGSLDHGRFLSGTRYRQVS